MSEEKSPVFVIVGGSGGIGSAVARRLATNGGRTVLAARDEDRLQSAAEEIGADSVPLDARDSEAVDALLKSAKEKYGRVDGVLNCAGSILLKPAHQLKDEEFSDTLAQNLTTAFNLTRAAARMMMRQEGGGSIVLCSSAAARRGLVNHEAIAAAKAGVLGLTLSAAATYASKNLRFNAVAPGLVATPMTERITRNPAAAKTSASMHALGRLGRPGDVARMIVWLLDPGNDWVTGQVFGIDGGLATVRAG